MAGIDHPSQPPPDPPFKSWGPNLECDGGIWKWDLWKVTRVRWGHEGGARMRRFVTIIRRDTSGLASSPSVCHGRGPSASQGESLQQKANQLAPWSWTSQAPKVWEINSYCSGHPVYGIWLWQPGLTHTDRKGSKVTWERELLCGILG